MKLKSTPTSPKERAKNELIKEISAPGKRLDKPKKSKNGLVVLIVAIIFGFLAGFLGEITISALAIKYPDSPIFSAIYLNSYTSPTELIIRKETKNLSAQELQTDSIISSSSKFVVGMFKKKSPSQDALAEAYLDQERLGNGIILTNDGLVMTTTNVIANPQSEYLIVDQDGSFFTAEDIVIDWASHTTFFWIDRKSDVVADFDLDDSIPLAAYSYALFNSVRGNEVVASSPIKQSAASSVDLVESSEEFNRFITLSESFASTFEGAPVIRANGKVIGLVYSTDYPKETSTVLPYQYAIEKSPVVMKNKKISRPQLGVSYIDLSRQIGLLNNITAGKKEGLLVVKAKSWAENNLQPGDIILSVDDQDIQSNIYFTELIQFYSPQAQITLKVLRKDIEKTVPLKLMEL